MKTILICKDCYDQFESSSREDRLNLINKVSTPNNQINIFFTECMGICPPDKISVIELNKEVINPIQSKSFSWEQVNHLLSKEDTSY